MNGPPGTPMGLRAADDPLRVILANLRTPRVQNLAPILASSTVAPRYHGLDGSLIVTVVNGVPKVRFTKIGAPGPLAAGHRSTPEVSYNPKYKTKTKFYCERCSG